MDRLAALRIERDMLAALVAAAPRGRPEIVGRLRLVTTELLRAELGGATYDPTVKGRVWPETPSTAFGGPPPPAPTGEEPRVSDRTRWWDR